MRHATISRAKSKKNPHPTQICEAIYGYLEIGPYTLKDGIKVGSIDGRREVRSREDNVLLGYLLDETEEKYARDAGRLKSGDALFQYTTRTGKHLGAAVSISADEITRFLTRRNAYIVLAPEPTIGSLRSLWSKCRYYRIRHAESSRVVVFHVEAFRRRFRTDPVDLRLAPQVLATYSAERGLQLIHQLQPVMYWTVLGSLCMCFSFKERPLRDSIVNLALLLREVFPRFVLEVSHSHDPKAHVPGPTKGALISQGFQVLEDRLWLRASRYQTPALQLPSTPVSRQCTRFDACDSRILLERGNTEETRWGRDDPFKDKDTFASIVPKRRKESYDDKPLPGLNSVEFSRLRNRGCAVFLSSMDQQSAKWFAIDYDVVRGEDRVHVDEEWAHEHLAWERIDELQSMGIHILPRLSGRGIYLELLFNEHVDHILLESLPPLLINLFRAVSVGWTQTLRSAAMEDGSVVLEDKLSTRQLIRLPGSIHSTTGEVSRYLDGTFCRQATTSAADLRRVLDSQGVLTSYILPSLSSSFLRAAPQFDPCDVATVVSGSDSYWMSDHLVLKAETREKVVDHLVRLAKDRYPRRSEERMRLVAEEMISRCCRQKEITLPFQALKAKCGSTSGQKVKSARDAIVELGVVKQKEMVEYVWEPKVGLGFRGLLSDPTEAPAYLEYWSRRHCDRFILQKERAIALVREALKAHDGKESSASDEV